MKLTIYTDGGSRGNPGPAATGVVIKDEKNKRIVGVFLALIAIFLLVAMYSYIGTWYADQDKVLGANNIFSFLINYSQIVKYKIGVFRNVLSKEIVAMST